MGTTRIKLQGKAKWAKVFEENRDMVGYEDAYRSCEGAYTIQVELDKENFEKLLATGAAKAVNVVNKAKSLKVDINALFPVEIKFQRKHKDKFEWASGAPKVMKADGTEWSFADDGLIGNDSLVEVDVSVYTTSKATGTRLESVTVLDLVEYDEFKEYGAPADMEEVPF